MNPQHKIYRWYTVYTRVNQEKKIIKYLNDSKVEYYLPLKKNLKQWSDRKVWIEEPFFRNYLFVYISNVEYFNVLNVPGIMSYVTFEGKAHLMTNQQMDNIKTMIDQQEREIVVSREKVGKGQKAKVLYGPFKGMEGEVVKVSNKYRIVIRINSLGCNLYANIARDEIVVADKAVVGNPKMRETGKNWKRLMAIGGE